MALTKVQGSMMSSSPAVTVYTSGSGTYTVPANCSYLYVKMVGGGAGGWGGSIGTVGGATTFGTSLLTANGGNVAASINVNGGTGGTAIINSPATGIALTGGQGGGSMYTQYSAGGQGGTSAFGGSGSSGSAGLAGSAAATNTGSGGGGGGSAGAGVTNGGPGGGSGGYIEAYITSPTTTYAYTVGTAGNGGASGANESAGGNGGSGVIIITAFF